LSSTSNNSNSNSSSSNNRDYVLRGGARRLFESQSTEVLLSGAAGTGKSLAAWSKLHTVCSLVPNVRCLALRKTRESLTESGLVTFESRVLPPDHPVLASGGQRRMRQCYSYPNGSVIVLGGMDKPSKIMSTEYDLIYVQEAIELNEADWESLVTRLRNGVLPYQQILADTNPDAPGHWLKKRCDGGRCELIQSCHEDNPGLFDGRRYTPAGVAYLARLDALTGARKQRLRHGRWVQAEGVVYEGWSPSVHLCDRFEVPLDWPRYWAVDFGYTNPFCWQAWTRDEDGRLFRYKEIYHTRKLVADHARQIRQWMDEEANYYARKHKTTVESAAARLRPKAIVCDHDAEDRATLERELKLATVPARKEVTPGIQAVQARLRVQPDGRPRIYFMRDSLIEKDQELEEAKRPWRTEDEFDCYVWDEGGKGSTTTKDVPVKEFDHGLDCVRYITVHQDLGSASFGKEAAASVAGGARKKLSPGESSGGIRFGEGELAARNSRLFGR
jgi:phage terminase large subunit